MTQFETTGVAAEWAARRAHARPLWIEGFGPHPDRTAVDGPPDVVSVVMATRNRGRMTRTAIASVVAQTWPHWELVVVDDGSEDDSALIAEVMASRDERIRVVRIDHRGASAARNVGLTHCNGAYVAFLDSDETWEPDFLRALVAQLHGCAAEVAYANVRGLIGDGVRFRSPHVTLPELLLRPLLDLSSVLARRHIIDEVGAFDESLPRGGEYDYLIRLAQRTKLQYTPIVGRETTVHGPAYERVRTTESDEWLEVVQTRHEVDWASLARRRRSRWLQSIVVPISAEAGNALRAVREIEKGRREVIFVDHSEGEEAAGVLAPVIDAQPAYSYIRVPVPVTFEHAATLGFGRTRGRSVVLVNPASEHQVIEAADVIAARRVTPEMTQGMRP